MRGVRGIGGRAAKASSSHGANTGAAGGEEGDVPASDRASGEDDGNQFRRG
jgi:hypothetical protein